MIVFGQGMYSWRSRSRIIKSVNVEKTGIPAAWTVLGLSAMPTDHPLNVGMVGMHGNYGPNVLTNECDVLIAIRNAF